MRDLIVSAITLSIISTIARIILPYSKKFVSWLISKLVFRAEKLIQGSKMGVEKKHYVITRLKVFGIKTDELINGLIEDTVEVMNVKKSEISISLKQDLSTKMSQAVAGATDSMQTGIANKLNKEEGD